MCWQSRQCVSSFGRWCCSRPHLSLLFVLSSISWSHGEILISCLIKRPKNIRLTLRFSPKCHFHHPFSVYVLLVFKSRRTEDTRDKSLYRAAGISLIFLCQQSLQNYQSNCNTCFLLLVFVNFVYYFWIAWIEDLRSGRLTPPILDLKADFWWFKSFESNGMESSLEMQLLTPTKFPYSHWQGRYRRVRWSARSKCSLFYQEAEKERTL